MRILICSLCSLIAALHARIACAQKFIDLRTVAVTGVGWPPDPAAHGIIVDSVITAFDPHAAIGVVQKGMGNKPVNAFLKGGTQTELKALLDRLRTGGKECQHVVLKVDTIEISERTLATREMAFCRFAAEVLERTDSGWTSTYSFGTTLVHSGGMDATDDHAANIAHALDNCLRRYAKARDKSLLRSHLISERQLRRHFDRRAEDIAALIGGRAMKGVYISFMDFVEGTPDTTIRVDEKESKHTLETTQVVKLRTGGTELMAWGYSDGNRLYVNTGGSYNEVHFGREDLYTEWSPNGEVDMGDMAAAAYMFGVLGAAFITTDTPAKTGVPGRLDIDLISGSLVRTHGTRSNSEHWFCYTDECALDTSVCLFLYGGEEGCLRKGQHHVMRLTPRVEPAPVDVRVGEQRVQAELNTNATTDQVYLISVDEDGNLKVDKLGVSMAGSILDKLEPENEVK